MAKKSKKSSTVNSNALIVDFSKVSATPVSPTATLYIDPTTRMWFIGGSIDQTDGTTSYGNPRLANINSFSKGAKGKQGNGTGINIKATISRCAVGEAEEAAKQVAMAEAQARKEAYKSAKAGEVKQQVQTAIEQLIGSSFETVMTFKKRSK